MVATTTQQETPWYVVLVNGKPHDAKLYNDVNEARLTRNLLAATGAENVLVRRWGPPPPPPAPPAKPTPIKVLTVDMRAHTRNAHRTESHVYLIDDNRKRQLWLRVGELQLRWSDDGPSEVSARYTAGVTDCEHDSAYAFRFPVVALELQRGMGVDYSRVYFSAMIAPKVDEHWNAFRVPRTAFDPAKLDGATWCHARACAKKHLIVPEGYYGGPPHDAELHRQLAGQRIEIVIGMPPEAVEDEA